MPKDFAKSNQRRPQKRKAQKRPSPKTRVVFHGPSFSSGAIVGAVIVLLAAYAPEFIRSTPTPSPDQADSQVESGPSVEFEFPDLLQDQEIRAEPENYRPRQTDQSHPLSWEIQAASFRSADDAMELRARLLLENLPASVESGLVDDAIWFRVMVGPFTEKVHADRAMSRMRQMYLTPIWMNDHN